MLMPAAAASCSIAGGDLVLDVPGEDVADAGLAGLVAPEPVDDAAVDHAAHPGDLGEVLAVHDVAGAGAHDREHLAGLDGLGRRSGDVRVDVADRDRDALGQAGPGGGLGGQGAGGGAEAADLVGDLVVGEAGEVGVERGEELAARVGAVLEDALVAGGAGVADVAAAELPDDPVGGLDPVLGAGVELGILLEQLQALRELPLAGDESAVARQPRLAALAGELVDAVGLPLRGVVLPELDVGVRAVGELGQLAQRRAVGRDRQRGGGGEVGRDADDGCRVDAGGGDRLGDGGLQHVDVVGRDLQRPLGRERRAGGRQRLVDDAVLVVVDRGAELGPVGDPHDEGPAGQSAEVDTDDVALRVIAVRGRRRRQPGLLRRVRGCERRCGATGVLALTWIAYWRC